MLPEVCEREVTKGKDGGLASYGSVNGVKGVLMVRKSLIQEDCGRGRRLLAVVVRGPLAVEGAFGLQRGR